MLLETVLFDYTNPNWTNERDYCVIFLRQVEHHINKFLKRRGYLYLNQIYEALCVKWNPDDENPCIRYDEKQNKSIKFEMVELPNNAFVISIYHKD